MTNKSLAFDYFKRSKIRLKALYVLRDEGGGYGDDDFLPTENYNLEDANRFIAEVEWLIKLLDRALSET